MAQGLICDHHPTVFTRSFTLQDTQYTPYTWNWYEILYLWQAHDWTKNANLSQTIFFNVFFYVLIQI